MSFIIVNGCPNLVLTPGQELYTDADTTRVTCNYTRVTSFIFCSDDGHWIGVIDNCTQPSKFYKYRVILALIQLALSMLYNSLQIVYGCKLKLMIVY